MGDIKFDSVPAQVWVCPICGDRFIGGVHEADPETLAWIKLHGNWHQFNNGKPPGKILIP